MSNFARRYVFGLQPDQFKREIHLFRTFLSHGSGKYLLGNRNKLDLAKAQNTPGSEKFILSLRSWRLGERNLTLLLSNISDGRIYS
jgi:hypothetical protein